MNRLKAIFFDKDGVLVNLDATWCAGAWSLCRDLSMLCNGSRDADYFARLLGVTETGFAAEGSLFASGSQQEMYQCIVDRVPSLHVGLSDQTTCAEIEQRMFAASTPTPLGDVCGALQKLHEMGYLLAVLTNDMADFTRHCLQEIAIDHLVAEVMTADAGYGGKPQPAGFVEICRRLDVAPAEVMMVGDTIADIGVAHAAGAGLFVGVSVDYPSSKPALEGAGYIVPDVSALPKLMETTRL